MLIRKWRCSWSNADRRCSNYIWVINNFIAHQGVSYNRCLTVDWETPHFHWILDNLQCIMGSCDRWEFPPFFKSHCQSPGTALTEGKLPAVGDEKGDCERVYIACLAGQGGTLAYTCTNYRIGPHAMHITIKNNNTISYLPDRRNHFSKLEFFFSKTNTCISENRKISHWKNSRKNWIKICLTRWMPYV